MLLLLAAFPAAARADTRPLELGVHPAACQTGAAAADRAAVFEATMPAADGAVRLGMRFDLEERRAGARDFRRLKVPNFGVWQRSAPGVGGYVVDKRVEQLAAGSAYRVVVRFRWYDAEGAVVRRARRTSAACRQPDLRPDLRVVAITVEPGPDGADAVYRVSVRNEGRSGVADPFAVTLALDRTLLPAGEPVPALPPGATTVLSFSGPPCAADVVLRAVADSAGAVEESDEQDNVFTRRCGTA